MVDIVGVGLAAVGAIGLSGQTLFVRMGTLEGRASDALFVVLCINLALIAPLALLLEYPDFHLTFVSLVAFICAGALAMMTGRILFFTGITRIGASRADALKASVPLHSMVLAVIVLGETLSLQHFIGTILVVVGVALVSWESSRNAPLSQDVSVSALLLPLVAALFFGAEPIFAEIGFAEGTSYALGLFVKTLAAVVVFSGYLAARRAFPTVEGLRGNFKWLCAAGIMSTVASVSFYAALNQASVTIVVPIIQSSPLLVVLISFGLLQQLERVTIRLIASSSIVLLGAILVTLAS